MVYYGRQPKGAGVKKIQAPLLLHYAGLDKRINEGIPEFVRALKQANKTYELHITVMRTEYAVDFLSQLLVHEVMTRELVTLAGEEYVGVIRERLFKNRSEVRHQGFPVLNESGQLLGVVTYRDILDPKITLETRVVDLIKRPPVVTHQDNTLRETADHMVREGVGRLPVIERNSGKLVGIVSRSDLLMAHGRRLTDPAAK